MYHNANIFSKQRKGNLCMYPVGGISSLAMQKRISVSTTKLEVDSTRVVIVITTTVLTD